MRKQMHINHNIGIESLPWKDGTLMDYPLVLERVYQFIDLLRFWQLSKAEDPAQHVWHEVGREYVTETIFKNPLDWMAVKKLLLENDIIESDNQYIVDTKCISYRLRWKWIKDSGWKLYKAREVKEDRKKLPFEVKVDMETLNSIMNDLGYSAEEKERYNGFGQNIRGFYSQSPKENGNRRFIDAGFLPKPMRKAIKIDGEDTVSFDVKTCAATTLVGYIENLEEKMDYLELLEQDIYSFLADCEGIDRDTAKVKLASWLNGAKNPLYDAFFEVNFPNLHRKIAEKRKQKQLGKEIMKTESECVWQNLEKHRIKAVTVHDGAYVSKDELERALELTKMAFQTAGIEGVRINVEME